MLYPFDWTTSGATDLSAVRYEGLTIVGRPAEGPGDVRDVFGETEVGHLDMSIGSKQQVLRLEVAVDDVE